MAEFFGIMKEEKAAATRVRILGILYLHRLVA
jgi:hypothetical protein